MYSGAIRVYSAAIRAYSAAIRVYSAGEFIRRKNPCILQILASLFGEERKKCKTLAVRCKIIGISYGLLGNTFCWFFRSVICWHEIPKSPTSPRAWTQLTHSSQLDVELQIFDLRSEADIVPKVAWTDNQHPKGQGQHPVQSLICMRILDRNQNSWLRKVSSQRSQKWSNEKKGITFIK